MLDCGHGEGKLFGNRCCWFSKYGVISGPYFPAFGLNTERYGVSLRIQSEYRKIRTRNNSVFGHFSHSVGWHHFISTFFGSFWVTEKFSIAERFKYLFFIAMTIYDNGAYSKEAKQFYFKFTSYINFSDVFLLYCWL